MLGLASKAPPLSRALKLKLARYLIKADQRDEARRQLNALARMGDKFNDQAEVDKLLALWRAGDVDAIARDFARDAKASPLLAKVLITDRNARWVDWIAGVMKRPGKVFVAVGAGHLGGPQGLLELLKARGLTAERLEIAAP